MNQIPANIQFHLKQAIPQLLPGKSVEYYPPPSGCCSSGPASYLRAYCISRGYTVERIGTNRYRITNRRPVKKYRLPILHKVKSFVDAITGPIVLDEIRQRRLLQCSSNECGYLESVSDKIYCGACSCPHTGLSELHHKLGYAEVECPLDPPFFLKAS